MMFACFKCCAEFHNESYLNEDGKLNGKWRNAADQSKGRNHKSKIGRVFTTVDAMLESQHGEEAEKTEDVMEFVKDKRVAAATDWQAEFGPACF